MIYDKSHTRRRDLGQICRNRCEKKLEQENPAMVIDVMDRERKKRMPLTVPSITSNKNQYQYAQIWYNLYSTTT